MVASVGGVPRTVRTLLARLAAERERDELRARLAEVTVPPLAAVAGPEAMEPPRTTVTAPEAHRGAQGRWQRLRGVFRRVAGPR